MPPIDRPPPTTETTDRPSRLEPLAPPDALPDPRQYDGKYLTPEIERVIKSHQDRPAETERKPWTLDTPVGKNETAGDVLRRHHGDELPPETVRKNADYIAEKGNDKSPWLKEAADADPLVQSVYVERDQSVGHDLQRHEGWRGDQGQHDRALYQRDPHHPENSPEYLRSNDFFGQGRLHDCWGYATHIPDPVAYATTYARIAEHPRVKDALSGPFVRDNEPLAIRDIPIDEILGPDGHAAISGYELAGDNMKEATADRRDWIRAVRAEIDKGLTSDEAEEKVRSSAADMNLPEPAVRPIESFAGGMFSVQFGLNRDKSGFEIVSFHASPRRVES
ncbi:hypothetical protein [Tenggerimyces flavus]|uniref:Uncharacterized protein n=1 Tax=Tenggerimyces flavus TaxID=1708749 RepID=A0ABV7YEW3_9ACTN|nr:hypothetical protein [Tenggerimyces flavus]MBM7786787.1 hypothetical protein [Tenggerimyces flavus]